MRHITPIVAAAALTLLGGCSSYQNIEGVEAKFRDTRTFSLAAGSPLEVDVSSGRGRIDIGPAGTPLPTWAVEAGMAEPAMLEHGQVFVGAVVQSDREGRIESTTLEPRVVSNTLTFDLRWPSGRLNADGVEYVIRAASIGAVEARSSIGTITVLDPAGPLDIRSSIGDAVVTDPGSRVDIVLDLGNATVTLGQHCTGPVNIDSDLGNIRLIADPSILGDVTASTDLGDVNFTGDRSSVPGQLRLKSNRLWIEATDNNGPTADISTDLGDVIIELVRN